ncbi:MAG: MBL fold metallo-hydrolase [Deltaproteobacteria bacterium]|nr:MBL fold metallo-hydrolase [Deltaproteobacteria bacterium]
MGTDIQERARKILTGSEGAKAVSEGIFILPAQGNGLAVETGDGVVLVDSGPGGKATARMIDALRDFTNLPVQAICYSHGHLGYNEGAALWLQHNEGRSEPAPQLIAHENCLRRYRRYRETLGLQRTLASMQFPGTRLSFKMFDPTLTFSTRLSLPSKTRRIELIWVPSETDDTIAMWLPDDGVLYAGAAFPGTTIPNIGTPLRTQRFTMRWAESCELMAGLGAARLIQEFGPIIDDPLEIHDRLMHTAATLRWFRREVVERMNRGMSEHEILADMHYDEAMLDRPYLKARYGAPEYIVRDLFREETGWWDRNPTTLNPAAPSAAAAAVRAAIADPEAVLREAETLRDRGEVQLALHVIDLLALSDADDDITRRARTIKAQLCRLRAQQVRPYVSKALFETSALLLERGATSWTSVAKDGAK